MRAGTLRTRVLIQQRALGRDGFGQQVTTWSTLSEAWAAIEPMSGRELELAQAVSAEVTHQVTIRYRPGITQAMRIVYNGRVFDIHSVLDADMRHREMVLMCGEGLNQGG